MPSPVGHFLGGVIAGLAVVRPRSWSLALACAAAWGSHVALDWLGTDAVAPIGIMALWPFEEAQHLSSLQWFLPIHRELRELSTWTHNAWAVVREALLLGPLALVVLWVRRRSG